MRMIILIDHEHIQRVTGLKQTAAMKRALKRAGLPFREANGRLFSTEAAWTNAQAGRAKKKRPDYGKLA